MNVRFVLSILDDTTTDFSFVGAIKASDRKGLQPAMDHIFENEGKPVPDLTAVVETSKPMPSQTVDEDEEDLAAPPNLGVNGVATAAANTTQAEAKVYSYSESCTMMISVTQRF